VNEDGVVCGSVMDDDIRKKSADLTAKNSQEQRNTDKTVTRYSQLDSFVFFINAIFRLQHRNGGKLDLKLRYFQSYSIQVIRHPFWASQPNRLFQVPNSNRFVLSRT
jgi:hypothetical protein